MLRARAILALATLLSLALLRPAHWGVHALGGHAGCNDTVATMVHEPGHAGCDHDHGPADATGSDHSHDHAPSDRDDLADCELCLAIGLLAADLGTAAPHDLHALPVGQPIPPSAVAPTCRTDHAPLHARPPPASTT
jgi:hypothetical protein